MKIVYYISFIFISLVITANLSFKTANSNTYIKLYNAQIQDFIQAQENLLKEIEMSSLNNSVEKEDLMNKINQSRLKLKASDFWLRYLNPVSYLRINGPLPVEWETEVFEKFEPPYKREGTGFNLAAQYMQEEDVSKDSLLFLIKSSVEHTQGYLSDSFKTQLLTHDHFYLTNRLYLLNLAALYTTGFECPDSNRILPELQHMMQEVQQIYRAYDESYPTFPVYKKYIDLYKQAVIFVANQPKTNTSFDHFTFIRDYINPLFSINQQMMLDYHVRSSSFNDFSLNSKSTSIFDKSLYTAQNSKGIYFNVEDEKVLSEIKAIGKLLFYDPLLSGNNMRSCASCHKPTEYFTDTTVTTAIQYNRQKSLPRNTPSLINVVYNHLLMQDGKHISLLGQAKDVISNPLEMGSDEKNILKKVLSCPDYKEAFERFSRYTSNPKKNGIDHIISAIMLYYSSFSNAEAAFDDAMNRKGTLSADCISGFNLFMSKAACGTCHFVPQFNGVKPPYNNSEFEVLGTPASAAFLAISTDKGRSLIYPSEQMDHAFRTPTLRNSSFTKPYMHNGVFNSLDEVIDFYDAGGAVGKKMKISNQSLPVDSLHLTEKEKAQLKAFISSLNEKLQFEHAPEKLPASKIKSLNSRKTGGEY